MQTSLEKLVKIHRAKLKYSKVKITCSFQGFEVEDGKVTNKICTDEQRVMQVLHNFVTNAIKFTSQGEISILVEFIEGRSDNYLQISVKDTGIGIKKKDQRKLFKLFGFLNNTKQMNTKGIGLGLAICKKIVTEFDGDVGVQSKVNEGSTFTFSFKLNDGVSLEDAEDQN